MLLDTINPDDWLIAHFNEIVELSLKSQTGTLVPVIATFTDERDYGVPQLSALLEINQDNLPELFAFHSASGKSVPYPGLLDDIREKTPKQTLIWWAKTIMTIDMSYMAN